MSCSYHPIRWHSISQNYHRCIMSWIRVRMTTTDHTHIHTHTHTHTWMVDCADGGKTVNGIKVLVSCPTATCTLASLRFCEEPRVHGLDTFEGEGPHHQNVAGREGEEESSYTILPPAITSNYTLIFICRFARRHSAAQYWSTSLNLNTYNRTHKHIPDVTRVAPLESMYNYICLLAHAKQGVCLLFAILSV